MPTSAPDCSFCAVIRGTDPGAREVYRDKYVVAFFPLEPAALGHTLVVPVDHVPDIWSLDDLTATHLARVTVRLAAVMRRALNPEGLNVIQSNGEAATQTVFHLHVHVVPRWAGDEVGPIWPRETNYRESEKDAAWEALRVACQEVSTDDMSGVSIGPEDRRKHLDFIQAAITRMSAASSSSKSWMLPLITATYGYALVQDARSIAWLGVGAVLLFAYLDANYLRQEKRFRRLYKAVAEGGNRIAVFSLNPDDVSTTANGRSTEEWGRWMPRVINRFIPGPSVWISWAIGPFYFAVLAVGVWIAAISE